jgi:hypothetical protein
MLLSAQQRRTSAQATQLIQSSDQTTSASRRTGGCLPAASSSSRAWNSSSSTHRSSAIYCRPRLHSSTRSKVTPDAEERQFHVGQHCRGDRARDSIVMGYRLGCSRFAGRRFGADTGRKSEANQGVRAAWMASQIAELVAGNGMSRTPIGASASRMALTITASVGVVPPSPPALMP